jgi:integrase
MPTGRVDRNGNAEYRRVQRSTGTADETRARQLAISYERAAVLAGEKRWTENSARRFLAEINAIAGLQVAEVEPTDQFLARWLKSRKRTVEHRSWQNYEDVVDDFTEWLGSRKSAPLVDVTSNVMAEFRDAELAAGKSGTTVNKALSILGQAFDEAVARNVMESNPARGLRVKGADKKAQKRRPFTFEQFRSLIAATAPGFVPAGKITWKEHQPNAEWQTFIYSTGYTGGRQQETAKLGWETVKFKEHAIGMRRTKNADVHWMPMHPALEAHLLIKWNDAGRPASGPVMPHIAGLPERKVSRYFRETLLPRIGIRQEYAEGSKEKGVGRKLAAYSIHSLRHSLSTWLRAAGVEESMRMQLIGHEDEEVNRGYTHAEMADAAAELGKIESV